MTMIQRLASVLGRRDDVPNQELARELAQSGDHEAIADLVQHLWHKDIAIRSDCIKVLYELGYIRPDLVAPHVAEFLKLLRSRNNRLVWGAMGALATIASLAPDPIYQDLDLVLQTIEHGSVITVDGGISVLARVSAADESCEGRIIPFLLRHLESCRPKEVGQHAERSLVAINARNKDAFEKVLTSRLDALTEAQQARVRKVLRAIAGL